MTKQVSDRTVKIVFVLFFVISIVCNFTILSIIKDANIVNDIKIKGFAGTVGGISDISKPAIVTMCVNTAPNLSTSSCSNQASVNGTYECTVIAFDVDPEQNLSFYDDSDLFDINSTGSFSFIPSSADEGIHYFNITVWDDSACSNGFNSGILTMAIGQQFCSISCSSSNCFTCPQIIITLDSEDPFSEDIITDVNVTSSADFDSAPTLHAISRLGDYFQVISLTGSGSNWNGTMAVNNSFQEGISNFSILGYSSGVTVDVIYQGDTFVIDRGAPTTYDDAARGFHAVEYNVTIYPNDTYTDVNRTYYCVDHVPTMLDPNTNCSPSEEVNGSANFILSFNDSSRGTNYLRYYSIDNASNQQDGVSTQIVMNYLPIAEFGGTNGTILGSSNLLIESISSDPDNHTLTMFICNTSVSCMNDPASLWCTNSSSDNVSCAFASERTDQNYTWYAFIYDEVNESTTNSPFEQNFTTDSTAPTIINITANIQITNITLDLEYDEESTMLIEYGLTTEFGSNYYNDSFNTNLSIFIDGLSANTTYYLRFTTQDVYSNNRTTRDYAFRTPEIHSFESICNESLLINQSIISPFGMVLEAKVNDCLRDVNITLTSSEFPLANMTLSIPGLIYWKIDEDPRLVPGNTEYVYIELYYNESKVNDTMLDEQSLRAYYYNESTNIWDRFDYPISNVSVDDDFVWINLPHFSIYSVMGKYINGQNCTSDEECSSDNCALDYDEIPLAPNGWCVPQGNCAHDGEPSTLPFCSGNNLYSCSNGNWNSASCDYGCSSGSCNPAPAPSSPSGGGGGSDGGGGAPPKTTDYSEKCWGAIKLGYLEFTASNNIVAITKLGFNIVNEIKNTCIKVKVRQANELSPPLYEPVYQHISLEGKTVIENSDGTMTTYFRISRSWMDTKNVKPNEVFLYSKQGSDWQVERTFIAKQDTTYDYFSSQSNVAAEPILYYGIATHRIEPETDIIKVVLKQGTEFRKTFLITNTGSWNARTRLSLAGFNNIPGTAALVSIDSEDQNFMFQAKAQNEVGLNFKADASTAPGIYVGKIIAETEYSKKEIQVIVEVESTDVYFDVSLDIPADYRNPLVGGELIYQIILVNMKKIGMETVALTYSIIDSDGNVIFSQSEDAAVDKDVTFNRKIILGGNIPPGNYILAVRALYQGENGISSLGTASERFRIVESAPAPTEIPAGIQQAGFSQSKYTWGFALVIIGIVLMVVTIIIYSFQTFRRVENKLSRIAVIRSQLNRKRDLLEQGHTKGYITDDAYNKGIARIHAELEKLEK